MIQSPVDFRQLTEHLPNRSGIRGTRLTQKLVEHEWRDLRSIPDIPRQAASNQVLLCDHYLTAVARHHGDNNQWMLSHTQQICERLEGPASVMSPDSVYQLKNTLLTASPYQVITALSGTFLGLPE